MKATSYGWGSLSPAGQGAASAADASHDTVPDIVSTCWAPCPIVLNLLSRLSPARSMEPVLAARVVYVMVWPNAAVVGSTVVESTTPAVGSRRVTRRAEFLLGSGSGTDDVTAAVAVAVAPEPKRPAIVMTTALAAGIVGKVADA